MKDITISKQNNNVKGRVFSNKRKLELAKDITRLRRYSAKEVAEIFGTSRQLINYHMRKEQNEK